MNHLLYGLATVLSLSPLASLIAADAPATRPNILFIFSDDHAQHAISAYGSKVNQTPNIDRLAREGARFTNSFVTNSICTPSRATLLTGQYSHLNGVPVFNRFDGARDNVAKHLQAGGYHTGMIGKWHLGSDPTGFDRWIVLPGQGAYWNPDIPRSRSQAHHPGPLHRHHHRPRPRVAQDAPAGQAVLSHAPSQGPAPRVGAR